MTLRQRKPRQHDAAHLAYVRLQPCCVCRKPGPSEAAHIRMNCAAIGKETGAGEKPDDRYSTPLCAYHHRTGPVAEHHLTEAVFWPMFRLDPFAIAARLWIESGGAAREQQERPAKPPRKIRPRRPPGSRTKIKSNPVFQSRGFGTQSRPFAKRNAR